MQILERLIPATVFSDCTFCVIPVSSLLAWNFTILFVVDNLQMNYKHTRIYSEIRNLMLVPSNPTYVCK
jgi:hypothetical protein